MGAPIQTQWNGNEINCDMPKSNEKVPIRRAKRCKKDDTSRQGRTQDFPKGGTEKLHVYGQ